MCSGLQFRYGLWVPVKSFERFFFCVEAYNRISALEELGFSFVGLFSDCFIIFFLWFYVGVIDF